jgi:dTDP-4-amino-4,6-dideoxygalactose transaminase
MSKIVVTPPCLPPLEAFIPLISSFPMYRGLPSAAPSNLPVATELASQVICLPIDPAMTDEDVERVLSTVTLTDRCALVF